MKFYQLKKPPFWARNDEMLQQYKEADFIVLVHAMHNFSLPAPVKAWFDAVLQPNQTFKLTEKGYEGLCHGTKAAILMTTGGDYKLDIVKDMNFATGLTNHLFWSNWHPFSAYFSIWNEHLPRQNRANTFRFEKRDRGFGEGMV